MLQEDVQPPAADPVSVSLAGAPNKGRPLDHWLVPWGSLPQNLHSYVEVPAVVLILHQHSFGLESALLTSPTLSLMASSQQNTALSILEPSMLLHPCAYARAVSSASNVLHPC